MVEETEVEAKVGFQSNPPQSESGGMLFGTDATSELPNTLDSVKTFSRPNKKSLTWDQCTFSSILPSLREDMNQNQGEESSLVETDFSNESNWTFQRQDTIEYNFPTNSKQQDAQILQTESNDEERQNNIDLEQLTRPISPRSSNDNMSSSSPSSACSSSASATKGSSPSGSGSPPTSPTGILSIDQNGEELLENTKDSSDGDGSDFIRSRYISRSYGGNGNEIPNNLETIVEDFSSTRDSPNSRLIGRRRVTLGANLGDVEYAESVASKLVNDLYQAAPARKASNSVEDVGFGWGNPSSTSPSLQMAPNTGSGSVSDGSDAGSPPATISQQNSMQDIDMDALRKQVDSWKTFFLDEDNTEEEKETLKGSLERSRRHSTPPSQIRIPASVSTSPAPGARSEQHSQYSQSTGSDHDDFEQDEKSRPGVDSGSNGNSASPGEYQGFVAPSPLITSPPPPHEHQNNVNYPGQGQHQHQPHYGGFGNSLGGFQHQPMGPASYSSSPPMHSSVQQGHGGLPPPPQHDHRGWNEWMNHMPAYYPPNPHGHHFQQYQPPMVQVNVNPHHGNNVGLQQRQKDVHHPMQNNMNQRQLQHQQQMNMNAPRKNSNNNRRGNNKHGGRSGSNSGATCESLLEYRATGTRPTMEALLGNVVEYSRDSHGSRFIQFKMETATDAEKQLLVDEVLEDAVSLASHPFGNYVIQNFLLHATPEQRYSIACTFYGHMIKLSTQAHGCRVVQHAIDILDTPLRNLLMEEIIQNIYVVAKNNHGTHVVQKCMNILLHETQNSRSKVSKMDSKCKTVGTPTSKEILQSVEKAVAGDMLKLAIHPHSYRLVQQTIGDCNPNRSPAVAEILSTVESCYRALAVDQHGNFILQHILDNGSIEQVANVQAFVCSRVLELSQHKFGSHLVEKCLTSATPDQANAIVAQLLEPTGHNASFKKGLKGTDHGGEDCTLLMLSKDPYANFVVQRAFDASVGELRVRIANEIRHRSDVLSRFTYGRHILSHINRSDV